MRLIHVWIIRFTQYMYLINIIIITSRGRAKRAPCCTRFRYLPLHSYIPAHIHMHAIRCCKQGCERTDLAHMKSSKERIKGTDYVNSTCLILQYSGACTFISSCLSSDLSNQQTKSTQYKPQTAGILHRIIIT